MSDIKLPELPKPWDLQHDEDGRPQVLYTADQLREYAKQAAELEREACERAVLDCAPRMPWSLFDLGTGIWAEAVYMCAKAIRRRPRGTK